MNGAVPLVTMDQVDSVANISLAHYFYLSVKGNGDGGMA